MLWLVINLQHLTPNILPHKIPVRLSYLIKARPKILLFHKDVGAKCWCLSVLQRRGAWGEQPAMHLQAQRGKARDEQGMIVSRALAWQPCAHQGWDHHLIFVRALPVSNMGSGLPLQSRHCPGGAPHMSRQ